MIQFINSVTDGTQSLASNRYSINSCENNGYLNEDNSLTVFADSQVKFDVKPTSNSLKDMRNDLLDKNIIESKNGIIKFVQSYTFNSPSAATDFIIGGSNNGWLYWKDSNDELINDSLRIK